MNRPFHAAYHVYDLNQARIFYRDVLGCTEGRSSETWIDFDFFGNQLSLHLGTPFPTTRTGRVGEHHVLMPHLGVVLPLEEWLTLAERLTRLGTCFEIPPVIRFAGEPGEQRTMFFLDPSGNPIEVKGFKDFAGLFAQ
jgi:Predicted dioxygenase of extradiol dioxygenase family